MADAPTKTEGGQSFPAEAYAYTPDKTKPSTWKLRLWESPDAKETAKQVGMAIAALSPGGFRGRKVQVPSDALPTVKKRIFAAWRKVHPDDAVADAPATIKGSESVTDMTFSDIQDRVENAVRQWLLALDNAADGGGDAAQDECEALYQVWVSDITTTTAVFRNYSDLAGGPGLFQVDYVLDDAGNVTLGNCVPVLRQTTYAELPEVNVTGDDSGILPNGMPAMEASDRTVEASDRLEGRLLAAMGTDENGGRVYAVRIIAYGDSKNRRRYPEAVVRAAASRYEGAKAYDHHRTEAELATSTLQGLIGSYRNVTAGADGLEAQLHLFPSATHTAEALDASLEAQGAGLGPLVGISHDVFATFRPFALNGQPWQEATDITAVNSADVVADPAAGGRATRMVAGGSGDLDNKEEPTVAITATELAAALADATDEDKAKLAEALGVKAAEATAPPSKTTETNDQEATYGKASVAGGQIVRAVLESKDIDAKAAPAVLRLLPDRFSEADVVTATEGFSTLREDLAKAGLAPTVPDVTVTQESHDKKIAALDAMLAGNFREGYRSLKAAFVDITGYHEGALDSEDINRRILRECIGFDSGIRSTESVSAGTFNLILGDSVTRRMVAEYQQPSLSTWQKIVSSIVPLNDFRTQRIDRMGGYGVLPAVGEGGPYQPLTTPGNEEATYALTKRGGTEDLTLEAIANDDVRAVQRIPKKLGLAAAQTLYRFVWDFLDTNPTCSYDSTALFAVGHANTDTNTLTGGNVSTGRKKMRKQTAYGDSSDVLSIVPSVVAVCSDLEELAWEIATSAVAMPSGAPVGAATNIPNLHQNLELAVVDYWSSTTKWHLIADPALVPTIELGFYQGRQDPELFVQSDPMVGSVFTADKVTYKVRHIYSGALLDHRGFYRGNS